MNFTTKLTALLVASAAFLPSDTQAQTILWGAGSTNATEDSLGQFISTNGTLAGTPGWTTSGVPAGGVWTWSDDGVSDGFRAPYWVGQGVGEWITSQSINNGCAFLDSDWYDTGGVGAGLGTVLAPHNSTLVSPTIDLTGYADSILAVKFYVSYLEFQVTELSVGFSVDGGANYTDIDYRALTGGSGVRAWYNNETTVIFPGILDGVSNLSDCKLRFTFNGDYYFVAVDDVTLMVGYQHDLAFAGAAEGNEYRTTSPPAPFSAMPARVAEGFGPYIAGTLVTNNGAETIPSAATPTVHYDIAFESTPGTWTSVLSDSKTLGAIAPGAYVAALDTLTPALQAAYAANGQGNYRMMYWLSHTAPEGKPDNDTTRLYYQLTNDWYSAGPINADGTPAQPTGSSFPGVAGGNVCQRFEWGGLFYFPDTTQIALDSAAYRVFVDPNHNTAGFPSVVVTVNVYEFDAAAADLATAMQLRTLSLDTVEVLPAMLGTHINRSVKIVDPNIFNPVTLQYDYPYALSNGTISTGIDALYCITTSQTNVAGLIGSGGQRNGFFISTNELPYEWNDSVTIETLTPLRVTEGSAGTMGSETWYGGFTGPHAAPAISLKITQWPPISNVVYTEQNNNALNLFPNPANNVLNIALDLDKASNVRYILTDVQGRVLNMQMHNNVQNDVYTLDVTNLPAGVYFMNARTENAVFTKRFVKQ